MPGFMFATGIENSYPTIARKVRVDQMEKCGHYERWKEDLRLTRELDLHYLRWGPANYKVFLGPGKYEWEWVDQVVAEMKKLAIVPIVDLCHFGLPDWLGNFQNEEFPEYFAEYAGAFARRYPEIHYWTPVNEILVVRAFFGDVWVVERTGDDGQDVCAGGAEFVPGERAGDAGDSEVCAGRSVYPEREFGVCASEHAEGDEEARTS